jgi:type III secretory pathway component EscR
MGSMMNNKGNKIMNYVAGYTLYAIKMIGFVAFLPFIAVAFVITKLLGGEPLSLDDMGAGFMIMCAIAAALAIGTGFFFLGTLI